MLEKLNNIIKTDFFNNVLFDWGIFILTFLAIFIVLKILKNFIYKKLERFSQKTSNKVDDYITSSIGSISDFFIFFLAVFISSKFISLDDQIVFRIQQIFIIVFLWQFTKWAIAISSLVFEKYKSTREAENDMHSVTAISGLTKLARFVIWTIFLLLALDNLGVNITALVAGLGIGGLAIALAAQSILGDLFASLTIMIDKPIAIGDYIVIDNYMGTVKNIGIKSTKIESLSGEEIIISNSDLLNSRLRNYHQSRMQKRRTTIMLGVVYNTPYEKLNSIQPLLTNIVNSMKSTDFVRASMVEFADFSLNFELVYNVLSSDHTEYIEINHKLRMKIFEEFEKNNIDFAFPTRTIHIENS
tara:strand:+ start:38792 stop:39865 length:1074 start_codon:yes stop_codon:yes gene_type:complete